MSRVYIQTAQYDESGTRTAKNVSTISATISNVDTSTLVQTFTQNDVTNDITGRYYVVPAQSNIVSGSIYNTTWKVGFTAASVITDNRRFCWAAAVQASGIPRPILISKNARRVLVSRNP